MRTRSPHQKTILTALVTAGILSLGCAGSSNESAPVGSGARGTDPAVARGSGHAIDEKEAVDSAVAGLEELTGRPATPESRALATQMLRLLRRMMAQAHVDEVGAAGDALRMRALELVGTGELASATTSEGVILGYTILPVEGGHLHHISLSFAGGGLTVSTGRWLLHGLVRRYGLSAATPGLAFPDRRVLHWVALVDAPTHSRFADGVQGPLLSVQDFGSVELREWFSRVGKIQSSVKALYDAAEAE